MKIKHILMILITALFFVSNTYSQDSTDTTFKEVKIKTSSQCEQCKDKIEKAVNKLSGIKTAVLDIDSQMLTVNYNGTETNLDEIRQKVSDTGYDADDVAANPRAYKKLPKCCQKDGHK